MEQRDIVSTRLQEARKRLGWTQKKAAEKLGVTPTGYYYYETGKVKINSNNIRNICNIFHISPSYLLGITDDPTPESQTGIVSVPVYGSIAAGVPLETFEQNGTFEIPSKIAHKYPNAFLLEVRGESMNNILPNGCLALVDPCNDIDYQDKPYAVSINGDTATIKRVKKLSNGFELIPDSSDSTCRKKVYDYGDSTTEEVAIIGRVVWYTLPDDWSF